MVAVWVSQGIFHPPLVWDEPCSPVPRFDSRDTCEKVISAYNNSPIYKNGEEFTIQIRYADTQEQKMLKQQTAAGRQFRAAEYEFGVAQARGTQVYAGRLEGLTAQEHEAASEFESFMSNNS